MKIKSSGRDTLKCYQHIEQLSGNRNEVDLKINNFLHKRTQAQEDRGLFDSGNYSICNRYDKDTQKIVAFSCVKPFLLRAENRKPHVPRSRDGKLARYDAYVRSLRRSSRNLAGNSLTISMPRDDGPNASSRHLKGTEAKGEVRSSILRDHRNWHLYD